MIGYDCMARDVMMLVLKERRRQEQLKKEGKFYFDCGEKAVSHIRKLAVLSEEFGEVAKLICDLDSSVKPTFTTEELRKELIQVAAVCVAWVESLDNED